MTRRELIETIRRKKSFLCIGLDPDPAKLPECVKHFSNPVLEFNRRIIEATHDLCVAYKPNTAFFESLGSKGWQTLHETFDLIPPGIFKIADAKRGDIGNTASHYAIAFFENMKADAVTLSPYMGRDAIQPFLNHEGKWAIVLGVTSNKGADDFQFLRSGAADKQLFEEVISKTVSWGSEENTMFVAGATRAELLATVRKHAPDHFLLVPGIGAQGGSLRDVCQYGMTKDCGLLVNASRSILFASSGDDFDVKARNAAEDIRHEMEILLSEHHLI